MIAKIECLGESFKVNLNKPIDISIPLKSGKQNPNAWYIDHPKIEPVKIGDWIGEVKQGGSVNFFNIKFNPHGNGTHTECVGHISEKKHSINECVRTYFFVAELISVYPKQNGNEKIIALSDVKRAIRNKRPEAIIIRTLPNNQSKKLKQYSNTNPPYLQKEAALFLKEKKIKHLLIDLPSVDREKDDGRLSAHRAFWNYPEKPRLQCSITELIYVPNNIKDGRYLLNLCFAPFENDASPSRPTIYAVEQS